MIGAFNALAVIFTLGCTDPAVGGGTVEPPGGESIIGPTGDSVLYSTALPGNQVPIGGLIEHEGYVYVTSEDLNSPGTKNILYKLSGDLVIVDSLVFGSEVSLQVASSRMLIAEESTLFISSITGNIFVDVSSSPMEHTVVFENSHSYGNTLLNEDVIYTYDQRSPTVFDIISTRPSSASQWEPVFSIQVDAEVNRAGVRSLNHTLYQGHEIMVFSVSGVEEQSDTLIQWFGAYNLTSDTLMYLLPGESYLTDTYSTPSVSAALILDDNIFFRAGQAYVGLDLMSGSIKYVIDTLENRSINSNSGYPSLNGKVVFSASNGLGPAVGIDITTGEVLWTGDFSQNLSATMPYGRYFLSTSNGKGTFDKVDAQTGSILWQWKSPLRESGEIGDASFVTQFALVGEEAVIHDFYQIYRVALGGK